MINPLPPFDAALVPRVRGDVVHIHGDIDHVSPLMSITRPIVAQSTLAAVERGLISFDDPVDPEGSTVRHLLAYALDLLFEGRRPTAAPRERRIYSDEGFDVLGEVIEATTGTDTAQQVHKMVFEPLGMTMADIPGSPAHAGVASASDAGLFGAEPTRPTLLSGLLAVLAALPQPPVLADVVPGYGHFSPYPWGLGLEVHGERSPYWAMPDTSPRTIEHFGQSGSFMWTDRGLRVSAAFVGTRPLGLRHHDNWSALNAELLCLAREHA